MSKVFVYGTLLNTPIGKKIGVGAVKGSLYRLGGIPGFKREGENFVYGQLYEVTSEKLAELDTYEGHPTFYRRERIKVILYRYDKETHAWIYVYRRGVDPDSLVKSGSWLGERSMV